MNKIIVSDLLTLKKRKIKEILDLKKIKRTDPRTKIDILVNKTMPKSEPLVEVESDYIFFLFLLSIFQRTSRIRGIGLKAERWIQRYPDITIEELAKNLKNKVILPSKPQKGLPSKMNQIK